MNVLVNKNYWKIFKWAGKCPDLQVENIQKVDFPTYYVVLAVDMCLKNKHIISKFVCV